jgi:hypothetical protein
MLYAAKCYWPGVRRSDVEAAAARAAQLGRDRPGAGPAYLGSLLFAEDDLVLCLFDGRSRTAVKQASERAGIPCERVMDSVWLEPHTVARAAHE